MFIIIFGRNSLNKASVPSAEHCLLVRPSLGRGVEVPTLFGFFGAYGYVLLAEQPLWMHPSASGLHSSLRGKYRCQECPILFGVYIRTPNFWKLPNLSIAPPSVVELLKSSAQRVKVDSKKLEYGAGMI